MQSYSELVDKLLADGGDCLQKLHPTEPFDAGAVIEIREAPDTDLTGGREAGPLAPAVRAGLFYFYDALDEAHRLVQNLPGDLAAYWHGMVHRREGDFDNARYWFRRAGELPHFAALHSAAAAKSAVVARQITWDPYLFTGLCEQHKFGGEADDLIALQRIEFEVTFDYTWRQAVR